jgi:hypothetical protein
MLKASPVAGTFFRGLGISKLQFSITRDEIICRSILFFFQFFLIKTLDPDPDSLEILDPDSFDPDDWLKLFLSLIFACVVRKQTVEIINEAYILFFASWVYILYLCISFVLYFIIFLCTQNAYIRNLPEHSEWACIPGLPGWGYHSTGLGWRDWPI